VHFGVGAVDNIKSLNIVLARWEIPAYKWFKRKSAAEFKLFGCHRFQESNKEISKPIFQM